MNVKLGLLMTTIFLLAGCNLLLITENPTPDTAAGSATLAPSPTPRTQAEARLPMTTQVDATSGVAFDYPTGWSIIAPDTEGAVAYSYSVASYNLTAALNTGSVPTGQTKIDVTFFGAGDTIDTALATLQADVDNGFAIVKDAETRTTADGSTAYYYTINGRLGGTARIMYAAVNGRVVSVAGYGDREQFDAVAASLRAAS